MGYAELIRALEEENERQAVALADDAARAALALVDAARQEALRERAVALERDAAEAARAEARARTLLRLEEEQQTLVALRELLAGIRAEALARLPASVDEPAALQLLGELVPELDGERAWTVRVDAAHVAAARRLLAERGARATVEGGTIGGAVAGAGGLILDNTLRARVDQAWEVLEPELVRILVEEGHV